MIRNDEKDSPLHSYPSRNILLSLYSMMVRIRVFEDCVADLIDSGEIKCPCHLYTGQEAVATGICSSLIHEDVVYSTHRSHGHYLAKGGDLNSLMAELFGRKNGCSHGHGGSMHISQPDKGLPGSSAIVAGTISLAVGTGLAFSIQEKPFVSVAFFGDGASNEGVFYESLNFAVLKKLPVLFICENNLYSTHMPINECLANPNIIEIARAFGIPGKQINGNDIVEVYNTAKTAIEEIRKGNGPVFLECMTYRWRGHVGPRDDIDKGLRSKDELDQWIRSCPIEQLENYLVEHEIIDNTSLCILREGINDEISVAVTRAKNAPSPDPNEDLNPSLAYKGV